MPKTTDIFSKITNVMFYVDIKEVYYDLKVSSILKNDINLALFINTT
ncbi:hypothetical protein QIA45_05235 (plasmid) [Borreliella andersonii]|uniref:Uncharacterized protein n=1 Tax=Borrelia andersonii TaxID=42109 RepID=A0ACD5G7B9_BORAD